MSIWELKRFRSKVSAFSTLSSLERKILFTLPVAGIVLFTIGKLVYFCHVVKYAHLQRAFGLALIPAGEALASVKSGGGTGLFFMIAGICLLAGFSFVFSHRASTRVISLGIVPSSKVMIGLVCNLCGFLSAILFHSVELLHEISCLGKRSVILKLYPYYLGLPVLSAVFFLFAAVLIYIGIRDTAREMKYAYPSGLAWTIKVAAFSAGAALLISCGLPVFYSGTFVFGGREFFYYILIAADIVFISFASLIGLLAFTGAYSIPEKRRVDSN